MSDNQSSKSMTQPKTPSQPFKGSEEIIKNLSTLPEGTEDREDLLDQVVPEEITQPENPSQNQPAQNEEGSNESK